jgi:hypothetical protein
MPKNRQHPRLVRAYRNIRHEHAASQIHRIARLVLGPSVVRVFRAGTKPKLETCLVAVASRELSKINSRAAFENWFEKQLEGVARTLRQKNARNKRVQPGLKWGHAAKVLSLFIRDVVSARVLSRRVSKRVEGFLFVPIDGPNLRHLRQLQVPVKFKAIKNIRSRGDFYVIQNLLADAAKQVGVPRVWFDDLWSRPELLRATDD